LQKGHCLNSFSEIELRKYGFAFRWMPLWLRKSPSLMVFVTWGKGCDPFYTVTWHLP
jgi:hypothetical protein